MLQKYHIGDIDYLKEEHDKVLEVLKEKADLLSSLNKNDDAELIYTTQSEMNRLNYTLRRLKDEIDRLTVAKQTKDIWQKLDEINEKNNCLRVRFYDWLASKCEGWAKSLRNRAYRITTPCAIKLPSKEAKPERNDILSRILKGTK